MSLDNKERALILMPPVCSECYVVTIMSFQHLHVTFIDIADPNWYRKYFEYQLEATRSCSSGGNTREEEFDISQLDPLKWKVL